MPTRRAGGLSSARSRAAAPTPSRQGRLAALRRSLDPPTDKPAVHAHRFGRFDPRLAGPHHRYRDTAQLRLRGQRQLAKISFDCHAGHIVRQPEIATYLPTGLVNCFESKY